MIDTLDGAYPDLATRSSVIADVLKEEEQIFRRTLDKGIRLLDQVFENTAYMAVKTVPGQVAFQLHATHGFPLDLTVQMATEKGWRVDEQGD